MLWTVSFLEIEKVVLAGTEQFIQHLGGSAASAAQFIQATGFNSHAASGEARACIRMAR